MPEQRQIIVKPNAVTPKSKGTRNVANIKACFPASPIHSGDITDEERRELFNKLVQEETILNGMGVNSFNPNYLDAPDLEDVVTGGGGLPASPYSPNPSSPGPGSLNAADQPEYQGNIPDKDLRNNFGTGKGGLVSPAETSKEIAKQSTLGQFISGKSYQGSDGKA